ENIIPVTLELGGKSPNLFFEDIMDQEDDYLDKALEGFAMFALNQGEICTCPSRALVQESIADKFLERAIERVKRIKTGHPLDTETMIGAQASQEQQDKILGCIATGREEGAEILTGGAERHEVAQGFYIEPTIFKGTNDMKTFQEEIFGPVLAVTTFKDFDDAIRIA
ncbi:aldehyde dehydrogenase family protein, partial [Escherichia coli]